MTSQAFILAGGRGTRLGELTRNLPKPMVPVGGKPFLEWLLLFLQQQGIREFVLSTGYLASEIDKHFRDGSQMGCRISYSVEEFPLGTGGALKKASSMLHDTFLVISGDNYLSVDGKDFMRRFHQAKDAAGMICCWDNNPPLFRKNAMFDKASCKIQAYDFNESQGKTHVDVGFKIFNRKLFDFFPSQEVFSLEIDTMPKLARQGLLLGYEVKHPPLDVGTIDGLNHAREALTQGDELHGKTE